MDIFYGHATTIETCHRWDDHPITNHEFEYLMGRKVITNPHNYQQFSCRVNGFSWFQNNPKGSYQNPIYTPARSPFSLFPLHKERKRYPL